jgi:hypothetical protein
MTARSILDFTKYCVDHNEYFRASAELDRLASYYPDFLSPAALALSRQYILFRGRQYWDITRELPADEDMHPSARIFGADAFFMMNDFTSMKLLLDKIPSSPYYSDMTAKRKLLADIMLEGSASLRSLERLYGSDFSAYRELAIYAVNMSSMKRIPSLALAAGAIPGMGYIYSGNASTGLVAMGLILVSSALTYLAWDSGNRGAAVFLGSITGFFYGGSILGGYMAANRYNRDLRESLKQDLIYRSSILKDQDEIYRKEGIGGL